MRLLTYFLLFPLLLNFVAATPTLVATVVSNQHSNHSIPLQYSYCTYRNHNNMSDDEQNLEEVADDFDEDDINMMEDDECKELVLENLKVSLKPRCDVYFTTKKLKNNDKIGSVELDIHKHFMRDAEGEDAEGLFRALGEAPNLKKLTITSKGSSPQSLPVSLLASCLGEAVGLQELILKHIKWKGDLDDFEDLACSFADHYALRVLELHVEAIDYLESSIASVGNIPSIETVEIHTTQAAADKNAITAALQALCTSKSLRTLGLHNLTLKFEILSSMARLLSVNDTLQELIIQASELDLNGGMAMAQMVTANTGLQKFILKLDKMHRTKLAEEFVQALEMNRTIQHFQIGLDGRMSDMKVVRAMQLMFRDSLKDNYTVSSQVGLSMGVTCLRKG